MSDSTRARIIAVANQKGGTGKTTTTLNLGAALVNSGERVLLVDMDSQANCSKGLGIILRGSDPSVRDVLVDPNVEIGQITRETAVGGLFVLPSHIYLSTVEMELSSQLGGGQRLAVALDKLRRDYDHIIIDAPPSLGVFAINTLVAADEILIPMEAEVFALDGMDALEVTIQNTKEYLYNAVELLGVLITKFRRGTKLHSELLDQLREHWRDKVFDTVIRNNIDVSAATAQELPVVVVNPDAPGAQDYAKLAQEVLLREKQEQAGP
jgi:chromosome partitioning protein